MAEYLIVTQDELYHHGILGMKWGVRRYQNKDGSLTLAGMERYNKNKEISDKYRDIAKASKDRADLLEKDAKGLRQLNSRKKAGMSDIDLYEASYYTQTYGKHGKLNTEKALKKMDKDALASRKTSELYSKAAKKLLDPNAIAEKTPDEIAKTRKRGAAFATTLGAAAIGVASSGLLSNLPVTMAVGYGTAAAAPTLTAGEAIGTALAASGVASLPVSVVLRVKSQLETSSLKTYVKNK